MPNPVFKRLNDDWNAEPNAPYEEVEVTGHTVRLTFLLNPWAYKAREGERALLAFERCSLWRLGSPNDEGWYRNQCRYGRLAPAWGKFYELLGDDDRALAPDDWVELAPWTPEKRHFLFYLRDCTFECLADDWRFEREIGPA